MPSIANVVVTGHSRGLGAAIASAFLENGSQVLGLSRRHNPELAARFGHQLRQVEIDLSHPAALAAWLDEGSLARFLTGETAAILINNAGLLQPVGQAGEQGARAIAEAVAVNVAAPLMLSDAFVDATRYSDDRRILHISSGAGRTAYAGWSLYCASKAALDHHARAVAADALPALRIASLAPGVIDTAMQAEIRATPLERFPLRERFDELKTGGGLSTPADVARQLLDYVLSPGFGAQAVTDLRTLAPAAVAE
ncbi:SDR family oxidoreductase [Paludibacterium yongneupense]|uniref:SDR family oxidoreductase n=1 Tax=Paludibacterium yongneupense TaxID=400061 RepID=UPI00040CDB28|nr:SDR family oxidoreductase [Paludibacterium yongneupense]